MSLAQARSNHFAMFAVEIIDNAQLSSHAKVILSKLLSFCGTNKREVFGYTKMLAQIINRSTRVVQECYRELINGGYIIDTGKKHLGIWRIFTIPNMLQKKQQQSSSYEADFAAPETSFVPCDEKRPREHSKQINSEDNNTVVDDCKNELSLPLSFPRRRESRIDATALESSLDSRLRGNDNSAVVQTLTQKGISFEQANQLLKEYGEDKCLKQVEHLALVQAENKAIKNPIAWLVSAIKKNFVVPDLKQEEQVQQISPLEKAQRELLFKAKFAMGCKDWAEAERLAREALTLGEREVFRKIIADAQRCFPVSI